MPGQDKNSVEISPRARRFVAGSILAVGLLFTTAVMVIALYIAIRDGVFSTVVKDHFIGVFGAPVATIVSMMLVVAFRVAGGPMEFKALGVEFKGSSGPLILWSFCFLLQILALSVLWKLG